MSTQIAPETVNGWPMLHQYISVDWQKAGSALADAAPFFEKWEKPSEEGQSALFYVYGHKASILLIHFRKDFDQLAHAQREIDYLFPADAFTHTYSFLSIVELGLYHATVSTRKKLLEQGLVVDSEEWKARYKEAMEPQYQNNYVKQRQWCPIPERKYVSFYPMNKRRGERDNWYTEELARRGEMMFEHGENGRRFAGRVEQIISGSIGFDEWEWGVDLFVDDPQVVKQLVYEMRFDEGSAKYAEFGDFLFAKRIWPKDAAEFFMAK